MAVAGEDVGNLAGSGCAAGDAEPVMAVVCVDGQFSGVEVQVERCAGAAVGEAVDSAQLSGFEDGGPDLGSGVMPAAMTEGILQGQDGPDGVLFALAVGRNQKRNIRAWWRCFLGIQ